MSLYISVVSPYFSLHASHEVGTSIKGMPYLGLLAHKIFKLNTMISIEGSGTSFSCSYIQRIVVDESLVERLDIQSH